MRGNSLNAAWEGPFRAPEHLALAMPLLSVIGVTGVVAAAATGQSTLVVALVAVAGFGLCALAPMALLEVYFGRPLRAALAHLRAARDGKAAPGAPPPGVIGDLVAVARDIDAGRAAAEGLRGALTLWEQLAAAGDETIRAFRLQTQELAKELAETAVRREGEQGASPLAEISEALRALKGAEPAVPIEAAMERIEQMLIYLAETAERRDGKDKQADESFERVEQAMSEIATLIAREAQVLRSDIAATVEDDKATQSLQFERVETLEARVLSRLASPETAGLAQTIRAEAEATRQMFSAKGAPPPDPRLAALDRLAEWPALRTAIETALARLDAGEVVARGVAQLSERMVEQTQAQAGRLDAIEANVAHKIVQGSEGEAKTLAALARTADKLRNAIDRLDALSASAAAVTSMNNDDVRAVLRGIESEVAGLGGRMEAAVHSLDFSALVDRIDGGLEGVAARVEASGQGQIERFDAQAQAILTRLAVDAAAFETQTNELTLAASVDAQTLAALRSDVGTVKARLAEVAPRVANANEALMLTLIERLNRRGLTPIEGPTRKFG